MDFERLQISYNYESRKSQSYLSPLYPFVYNMSDYVYEKEDEYWFPRAFNLQIPQTRKKARQNASK